MKKPHKVLAITLVILTATSTNLLAQAPPPPPAHDQTGNQPGGNAPIWRWGFLYCLVWELHMEEKNCIPKSKKKRINLKKTTMKTFKFLYITLFLALSTGIFAQSVSINSSGAAPTTDAMLEVLQGKTSGTVYSIYGSTTGAATTNFGGYFSATGATNKLWFGCY